MLRVNRAFQRSRMAAVVQTRRAILFQSAPRRLLSQNCVSCQEKTSPTPWYINLANRERALKQSIFQTQEIEFPPLSPPSLPKICHYLRDELGLTDILVFDLRRGAFDTAAAKISNFMIITTAASPKHCQTSFEKLNSLIKQEYESVAYVEGRINAKDQRKRQRRLARKPKVESSANSNVPTESWFMIDTKVDRIFVNIFTAKRRQEINLEELYAPEEDKPKYIQKPAEEPASENSDGNILAGLRRLVNQRREYSTAAPAALQCGKLLENMESMDYQSAFKLISNNRDYSLPFMRAIVDRVANLPTEGARALPWAEWVTAFESCWPLVIPEGKVAIYWSLRLQFFKLVNIADMEQYDMSRFFDDYLLAKKASGVPLVAEDLIEFLKLAIVNVRGGPQDVGYWHIVRANNLVVEALRLFEDVQGADRIVENGSVVTMLLRTMVSDQGGDRAIRLHAVYEVLGYLVDTFGPRLNPVAMSGVLEVLAAARDWGKYLQFWEVGMGALVPGEDRRPWSYFVELVVESGDKEMMRKLLAEGHLLWLKRFEVELDDKLREQLDRLFAQADPQGSCFRQLRDYLYM